MDVRAFAHVLFLCDVGLYTVQYRSRLCFTDSPGDYRCKVFQLFHLMSHISQIYPLTPQWLSHFKLTATLFKSVLFFYSTGDLCRQCQI